MNKKRIIFLAEHTLITARRLERALRAEGFDCSLLDSPEVVEKELEHPESIDLILHFPTVDPQKSFRRLQPILEAEPVIPILHVVEDLMFQPENWLLHPLHEWVHAHNPLPTFLRRVRTLLHFSQLERELQETQEKLRIESFRDDLTDLYNQRYLPLVLEQELSRSSRLQQNFSVLFMDIDFFKSVNDSKGHLVGSQVLIELSRLFRSSIRKSDFAFRYGGDEYVIVLSGANSQHAQLVAERLRQRTEKNVFQIRGNKVKLTVSIGIASFPEHATSAEELLQLADQAMYGGKNKSRNIVFIANAS